MNKHQRWLLDEIQLWRREGIVSADQARLLTARYNGDASSAWGKMIFSALGAIIFGLGVILLLAYNWEDMHRLVKLGLIIGAIAAAHGAGYWLSGPRSAHQKIGESLHLLGSMLFGAGIWLIAQIYHIDEHFPNALLVWALGALLMGWIIPSLAHTLLAMGLLALWHSFEVFQFDHPNHWATWLIVFGVVPQTWLHRSQVTLLVALGLVAYTYPISLMGMNPPSGAIVLGALFAIMTTYIIFSYAAISSRFAESAEVFRAVGFMIYAILLFLLSINAVSRALFEATLGQLRPLDWFYYLLPWVLLACSVGLLLRYRHAVTDTLDRIEISFVLIASVLVMLFTFGLLPHEASWLLFSVLFLTQSLLLVWQGTQQVSWPSAALGCAMLSAFIFARFLDLFQSLLMRSLAFLVLGAMLFAVGVYYSNQKQRQGGN